MYEAGSELTCCGAVFKSTGFRSDLDPANCVRWNNLTLKNFRFLLEKLGIMLPSLVETGGNVLRYLAECLDQEAVVTRLEAM